MPTYTVTNNVYRGHAPGETFEAQEDESIVRAIERGSIAPAAQAPPIPEEVSPKVVVPEAPVSAERR